MTTLSRRELLGTAAAAVAIGGCSKADGGEMLDLGANARVPHTLQAYRVRRVLEQAVDAQIGSTQVVIGREHGLHTRQPYGQAQV